MFVYTRQCMLFLVLYRQMFVLILKYRRKNIIVQLQNAKVSTTKIMLLSASMASLLMAGRKRTCYFDSVTNSDEEKQKSAAHTSSYITWQCTKYNHSPSSF